MNQKLSILLVFMLTQFPACAIFPPPATDQATSPQQETPKALSVPFALPTPTEAKSPVRETSSETVVQKDEELFIKGLQQLAESAATHDEHSQAKQIFETLISTYPKSKWHDAALLCVSFLRTMDIYHDKLRAEQESVNKQLKDNTKNIHEIEQLKKDIRTLNEKYQAEIATLQQENEQSRKDIQLLKNLEIQLERREKQLR